MIFVRGSVNIKICLILAQKLLLSTIELNMYLMVKEKSVKSILNSGVIKFNGVPGCK